MEDEPVVYGSLKDSRLWLSPKMGKLIHSVLSHVDRDEFLSSWIEQGGSKSDLGQVLAWVQPLADAEDISLTVRSRYNADEGVVCVRMPTQCRKSGHPFPRWIGFRRNEKTGRIVWYCRSCSKQRSHEQHLRADIERQRADG